MKINFLYFGKISLKFDFFPFLGDQNNIKKMLLREIVNNISYHRCLANETFVLVFDFNSF